MIIPLLLASVVAAEAPTARTWIKPLDYPVAAMRESRGGFTGYRLTFSPAGKPVRCDISYASGWDDLDKATCPLLLKRASVKPALDPAGRPAIFVYRSSQRWLIEGREPKRPAPPRHDAEKIVERLPVGVTGPARVEVAFMVDAAGQVSDCSPTKSAARPGPRQAADSQAIASLWNDACLEVAAKAKPAPALDAAGQPVASVQTMRVLFRRESDPVPAR